MNSPDSIQKRFDNVARSQTFRNIIAAYGLDTKRVLDIGCTYGEFLCHFGPGSTGLTISHEEVEEGKRRGLDVRYSNIETDEGVEGMYDVIFANNIFEQMQSPHLFLQKIKRYLAEDGLLILGVLCVPKVGSLMRFSKFRGALVSLHINFFTKETLAYTVTAAGWKITNVRGFHFSQSVIDRSLGWMYPHLYVVATVDTCFEYSAKRKLELEGYKNS